MKLTFQIRRFRICSRIFITIGVIFLFRDMRRKKCKLDRETSEKILLDGEFGVLALSGDEGYSYAVPINYAVENNKIYFHSAVTGHKLDAIKNNSKVSFCVVGHHEVVSEEFTSYYTSVIAFGKIKIIEDNNDPEKLRGLELLAEKYSPNEPTEHKEKEFSKIGGLVVMVLEIEHLTGKAARELIKKNIAHQL